MLPPDSLQPPSPPPVLLAPSEMAESSGAPNAVRGSRRRRSLAASSCISAVAASKRNINNPFATVCKVTPAPTRNASLLRRHAVQTVQLPPVSLAGASAGSINGAMLFSNAFAGPQLPPPSTPQQNPSPHVLTYSPFRRHRRNVSLAAAGGEHVSIPPLSLRRHTSSTSLHTARTVGLHHGGPSGNAGRSVAAAMPFHFKSDPHCLRRTAAAVPDINDVSFSDGAFRAASAAVPGRLAHRRMRSSLSVSNEPVAVGHHRHVHYQALDNKQTIALEICAETELLHQHPTPPLSAAEVMSNDRQCPDANSDIKPENQRHSKATSSSTIVMPPCGSRQSGQDVRDDTDGRPTEPAKCAAETATPQLSKSPSALSEHPSPPPSRPSMLSQPLLMRSESAGFAMSVRRQNIAQRSLFTVLMLDKIDILLDFAFALSYFYEMQYYTNESVKMELTTETPLYFSWIYVERPEGLFYFLLALAVFALLSSTARLFSAWSSFALFNVIDIFHAAAISITFFIKPYKNVFCIYLPYFVRSLFTIFRAHHMMRAPCATHISVAPRDFLREKIVSFFLIVFSMFTCSMCAFQIAEVAGNGNYNSFITSLYFITATLTTVGYGDVHPTTDGARVVVMVIILITFAMLPSLIHSAMAAWRESREYARYFTGSRPWFWSLIPLPSFLSRWRGAGASSNNHVVCIGDFTRPRLVIDILQALVKNESFGTPKVVFMSERTPSRTIKAIMRIPLFKSRVRFITGSAVSAFDLYRANVANAEAVFVFSDSSPVLSTSEARSNDELNVLRLWSVLACRPPSEASCGGGGGGGGSGSGGLSAPYNDTSDYGDTNGGVAYSRQAQGFAPAGLSHSHMDVPLNACNDNEAGDGSAPGGFYGLFRSSSIRSTDSEFEFVSRSRRKHYVTTLTPEFARFHSPYVTGSVCPSDFNLALLGLACTMRGVSTLIANLIATIPPLTDFSLPWLEQYADGALQEIQTVPCPAALAGRRFRDIGTFMYLELNALLIGVGVICELQTGNSAGASAANRKHESQNFAFDGTAPNGCKAVSPEKEDFSDACSASSCSRTSSCCSSRSSPDLLYEGEENDSTTHSGGKRCRKAGRDEDSINITRSHAAENQPLQRGCLKNHNDADNKPEQIYSLNESQKQGQQPMIAARGPCEPRAQQSHAPHDGGYIGDYPEDYDAGSLYDSGMDPKRRVLLNPSDLVLNGTEILIVIAHGLSIGKQLKKFTAEEIDCTLKEYRNVYKSSQTTTPKSAVSATFSKSAAAPGTDRPAPCERGVSVSENTLVHSHFANNGHSVTFPALQNVYESRAAQRAPLRSGAEIQEPRHLLHSTPLSQMMMATSGNFDGGSRASSLPHPSGRPRATRRNSGMSTGTPHHPNRQPSFEDIVDANADQLSGHIVVFASHWRIRRFLVAARDAHVPEDLLRPIFLVGSSAPKRSEFLDLFSFGDVHFMLGNPRNPEDLERAGIHRARRIVVLAADPASMPHVANTQNAGLEADASMLADMPAVLARHMIMEHLRRRRRNRDPEPLGCTTFTVVALHERDSVQLLGPTATVPCENPATLLHTAATARLLGNPTGYGHRTGASTTTHTMAAAAVAAAAQASSAALAMSSIGPEKEQTNLAGSGGTNGGLDAANKAQVCAQMRYNLTLAAQKQQQQHAYVRRQQEAVLEKNRRAAQRQQQQRQQQQRRDALYHPLYASGEIMYSGMTDVMLLHEHFRPLMLDAVRHLAGAGVSADSGTFVQVLEIPPVFHGVPYRALFYDLLASRGVVPLGLYRAANNKNLGNSRRFVYTNPSPRVALHQGDRVFVLARDVNAEDTINHDKK